MKFSFAAIFSLALVHTDDSQFIEKMTGEPDTAHSLYAKFCSIKAFVTTGFNANVESRDSSCSALRQLEEIITNAKTDMCGEGCIEAVRFLSEHYAPSRIVFPIR